MSDVIEQLAEARTALCKLVLQRDIEAEAWFKTRNKDEARRMMKELKALGYAERVDGVWRLTIAGQKRMREVEAQLRARR